MLRGSETRPGKTETALNRPRNDDISLTHDLDLQFPASYGQGLLLLWPQYSIYDISNINAKKSAS